MVSIVFEQAAQASLARLRGRVAGEGDPQVASDISRVALMGGVGSSSTGMAGAGGGLEVRSKAEPPVLLVLMTLRALLRSCLVVWGARSHFEFRRKRLCWFSVEGICCLYRQFVA